MPRVKDDDLPPGFYRKRGIVYVSIFDPALGRRVDTSTGFKDAEAAIIRARELERIAADPRAWNAERTTLSQAIEMKRAEMAELVIAKKMKQVTVDYYYEKATRLVRYFEHARDLSGRPLSCSCQKGLCPSYRPLKLADLQPPHGAGLVDAYISYRRSSVGEYSISKELGFLRQVLQLAKRRGHFAGDLDEVLPESFSPEYRPVERWLTQEEVSLLLPELLPDQAAQVAWMVALGSEWAAVVGALDLDIVGGDAVHVRGTKNEARDRVVPVVRPWQRALLEVALKQAGGTGGRLFAPWTQCLRDLKAACKRAGIPSCSPNDLRRTFATWLRAEGYAPSEIAMMMGHVDSTMVERVYGRLNPAQLAEVMLRRAAPGSANGATRVPEMADMVAAISAKSLKMAGPAGFEPAAFGFVVRGGVPVTSRERKRNRQDGAGRVVPTSVLRVISALALTFWSLASGCSHTSASSYKSEERQRAQIDALKQIVRAEQLTTDTHEVVRAAPVRVVVEEAWDEPTPDGGQVHHPKRTTTDQGPVETERTQEARRETTQETQEVRRETRASAVSTAASSSSKTAVGFEWWFWVAVIVAAGVFIVVYGWRIVRAWRPL